MFFSTLLFIGNLILINSNIFNILSFSGGGAFGAVEVGLLKKIHNDYPINYDLYTGISAGGLNAGFLSYFNNINDGIDELINICSTLKTSDVYKLLPLTNISLVNTESLRITLTKTLSKLNKSIIPTLIGTTNLNLGELDTFHFNLLNKKEQINLLMATSAIPIIFPPIEFKNYLYVDGGLITNELVSDIYSDDYINITFITTRLSLLPEYNLYTFKDIIKRNLNILSNTFDNEIAKLNYDCKIYRGEIYMYYVDADLLKSYSEINFDYGKELIDIGYNNLQYKKLMLC